MRFEFDANFLETNKNLAVNSKLLLSGFLKFPVGLLFGGHGIFNNMGLQFDFYIKNRT